MRAAPPKAPEIPHRLRAHGQERVDPFYWMRDREDPRVIQHLEQENAYTEVMLAPAREERAKILAELRARVEPNDESLPFLERGYYYYQRYSAGAEYPVYLRRRGALNGPEEILLDVNELARGHEFCEVHFPQPSPDGTNIVYAADFTGRRFFDLHVVDLATKRELECIPRTTGDVVWAADGRTLLYVRQDEETLRARWVFRRVLGGAEEIVFEETDETYSLDLGRSRTGNFLFLVSSAKMSTEWRVLAADQPGREPAIYHPRERNHEYSLEDSGSGFLVLSNWQAENFRLLEAPHAPTPKEAWREMIPHRSDVLLEGVDAFATHLVLSERFDGQSRLAVIERAAGMRREIAFPDPVYVAGVSENREFDARYLRYEYESLHRPESIYDYEFVRGSSELRREAPVPTYDSSQYATERAWAPARDGARVPISIVYRKGFARDGTAPILVYAYGSYGFSMEPWFQRNVVSLLDRGFVYAMAHIRGGSEMGRAWYDNGKLAKKWNTFHDFIDATEFLVRSGYAHPKRVSAMGGSAGGLLMGVVANERPDLFERIVAQVPFVDVLTTMLDESIPLTTSEYDEWGDPRVRADYEYMASYSPQDNVSPREYPAFLITAGLHDSQVQYWEPAKWAAKLRQNQSGPAPILLHTEMTAGHGGASGRYAALEEKAREYAFLVSDTFW